MTTPIDTTLMEEEEKKKVISTAGTSDSSTGDLPALSGTGEAEAEASKDQAQLAAKEGIFTNATTGKTYNAQGQEVDANGNLVTTTTPAATTTTTPTTPTTTTTAPATTTPSADISSLESTFTAGASELASAQQARQQGYLTEQEYIDYLNKWQPSAGTTGDGTTGTSGTAGTTTNQPANVQAEIDSIANQEATDIGEIAALTQSSLDAESEYRDTMADLANQKYETQQSNLDRMEELQKEVLAMRTAAIEASSEAARRDAEKLYEESMREMEVQRDRTTQAYKETLVEQQLSNTKRTLDMESYIAATGGFGSLVKQKEMTELTLQNDRVINSIRFEADAADREISSQIISINDEYQNDLFDIEVQKQNAINEAYSEYLSYVTDIQNDRELSVDEKYEAVQTAQADYKTNVASINWDSFNARYEVSQTAAEQVRDLKFRQIDTEMSLIYGYAVDAYGNAVLDEYGNKVYLPESMINANQYEFIEPQVDDYGRVITPGGYFDPSTGQFVADYSLGVPSSTRGAGGYNYSSPEYKQQVADIFGVGTSGGWCGVFASSISTASSVGDTWGEKAATIEYRDNPTSGDKLLIPAGVTDGMGYGHVAVVLSYDPTTGDIQVVESNADGAINKSGNTEDGMITLGTYNINDLRTQYGDNFGFVSGELKEPYADLYNSLSTYSAYNTTDYTDQYIAEAAYLGLTGDAAKNYIASRQAGYSAEQLFPQTIIDPKERADLETSLATKFDSYTEEPKNAMRNVRIIDAGYEEALAAIESGASLNAPSQAMLVTFQKMLDPTSVVRESEYARSGSGQSLANSVEGYYEKLVQGGAGVTIEDLQTFKEMSDRLLEGYIMDLYDAAQRTASQADTYGLDINNILTPEVIDVLSNPGNYFDTTVSQTKDEWAQTMAEEIGGGVTAQDVLDNFSTLEALAAEKGVEIDIISLLEAGFTDLNAIENELLKY